MLMYPLLQCCHFPSAYVKAEKPASKRRVKPADPRGKVMGFTDNVFDQKRVCYITLYSISSFGLPAAYGTYRKYMTDVVFPSSRGVRPLHLLRSRRPSRLYTLSHRLRVRSARCRSQARLSLVSQLHHVDGWTYRALSRIIRSLSN